ncbi:MAG: hypothetical protein EP298_12245 [Gammaproteobacteria bacterium]|nr:MAG: hypothetical protein EP298_12245 [Gammaproteobacteria bacterium]UTW43065.1 hypothetical protein KFE69_02670 [bacterium SCSIO 12844]
MKQNLEKKWFFLYAIAVLLGIIVNYFSNNHSQIFQPYILSSISLLLYAVFLQIPFTQTLYPLKNKRFLFALIIGNFIIIPLILYLSIPMIDLNTSFKFVLLLVLLTPSINYVVLFSKLGGGSDQLIRINTPILLILQMILIPIFLYFIFENTIQTMISIDLFTKTLLWIIIVPLLLAFISECLLKKVNNKFYVQQTIHLLPKFMLFLVLFLLFATYSQSMWLTSYPDLFTVCFIYLSFLVIMPVIAIPLGSLFSLTSAQTRTLAFSFLSRNSLIALPIAFVFSHQASVILSIILLQLCIELIGEVIYVRLMPNLIV